MKRDTLCLKCVIAKRNGFYIQGEIIVDGIVVVFKRDYFLIVSSLRLLNHAVGLDGQQLGVMTAGVFNRRGSSPSALLLTSVPSKQQPGPSRATSRTLNTRHTAGFTACDRGLQRHQRLCSKATEWDLEAICYHVQLLCRPPQILFAPSTCSQDTATLRCD